jgi:multidrug efflux pump subunit AcrA (membrane-fusion protein)
LRSVDLFYELPNPGGRLLLDQSLAVRARTRDPREAVTAPDAAVIYDSGGGAWLYVERSRLRYARRRVEPGVRFDGRVEIRRGLREGERVVAAGSSELFGSEFGAGGE